MQAPIRDVIWVGSYPKSGNTWVHDVLRTAGKRWGFPPGPMDVYDMLNSGRRPEICAPVLPQPASNPCSVLKTHALFAQDRQLHTFDDLSLRTVGFIYVYRNPLDLLLSYINFTRIEYVANQDNEQYRGWLFRDLLGMDQVPTSVEWAALTLDQMPRESLDHALKVFSDRGLTLPICFPNTPWSSHVRSWLAASRDVPSVVLKYEDCLADSNTFNAMAKFFEFGVGDIQKALASSAQRAAQVLSEGTIQQRIFYNKMQAFYYPTYFSPDCVKYFIDAHREVLIEFGYDNIAAGGTP